MPRSTKQRTAVGAAFEELAYRAMIDRFSSIIMPMLKRSLDRWIDWDALHRNVRTGLLDAVCVVRPTADRA